MNVKRRFGLLFSRFPKMKFQIFLWSCLIMFALSGCSLAKHSKVDSMLRELFPGGTSSTCSSCVQAFKQLLQSAKNNEPIFYVKFKLLMICRMANIKISLCSECADVFLPCLLEIFKMTTLSAPQICYILDLCPDVDVPPPTWSVQLPDTIKPALKEVPLPPVDAPKFKVLHLNDVHVDLQYRNGSNGNCDDILCCRNNSVSKKLGVYFPAGRWGDYKCDLPSGTFEKSLEHIATQHKDIDYIIWVGDIVPHDICQQTKSQILETINYTVAHMKRVFPNIRIFPNIGNHELFPCGLFPPPETNTLQCHVSWLLDELYYLWQDWLELSDKKNFIENGFYIATIRPGFKIISLNMNYCHILNGWLYVNSTDPGQQLDWLAKQLQEAENSGVKIHIIGHIPPGKPSCMKAWSESYYKIIARYESTVAAQFFGHTHSDQFKVFYDLDNTTRPVGVGYVAPSLTPYTAVNPAYRIYHIDNTVTMEVLDHDTWVLDLDTSNSQLLETPEWHHCYSAKDTYYFDSLRPDNWDTLIGKMRTDDNLFDTFYQHSHRASPVSPISTGQIKNEFLCTLKSHNSDGFC